MSYVPLSTSSPSPLPSPAPVATGKGYVPLSSGSPAPAATAAPTGAYTPISQVGLITPKEPAAPVTSPAAAPASTASGIPSSALKGSLGGGYGAAVDKDSSGKPLLTYENQQAKSSQLLPDRTASSFDPTVPQKIDSSVLQNGRMPESVSQAIKAQFPGSTADELDHIMPLELGGSNSKSNLRLEPGQNPNQPYSPSKNPTATDPIENYLAKQVQSGQMSLVDAWKAMAKAKNITLPEDGGPLAPKNLPTPKAPASSWLDTITNGIKSLGGAISSGVNSFLSAAQETQKADTKILASPTTPLSDQPLKTYIPGVKAPIISPSSVASQAVKGLVETPERTYNDIKDLVGVLSGKASQTVANAPSERVPSYIADMTSTYNAAKDSGLSDGQATVAAMLQGFGSGTLDISTAGDVLSGVSDRIVKATAQDLESISAWQTLGKPSTIEDAEAARNSLAHEFHPDKVGGSTEQMAQINNALDTLKQNGIPSNAKVILNRIFTKFSGPLGKAADTIDGALTRTPTLLGDGTAAETPVETPHAATPAEPTTPQAIVPKPEATPAMNARGGFVSGEGALQGIKETADEVKAAIQHAHETGVTAQGVDEGLRGIQNQNTADEIRLADIYKKANLTPQEEKNIYDAREAGTTASLTSKEQAANEKIITPLKDEQARIISKLKDRGLPVDDTHNSRIVMERGGFFDKLKEGVSGTKTKTGGLLTKSAPSLKRRTMLGLQDAEGNRVVISAKGGDVTAWKNGKPRKLGSYGSVANLSEGKPFVDKNGKQWTFTQATTKEIETNTNLKYSHYSLANELMTTQKLQSAERASDWLEQFKNEDPDFQKVAFKLGTGNPPAGYKMTDAPQFRGYVFEPRVAEAIDNYFKHTDDDGLVKLSKLNLYVRNVSLFNPFYHGPVNVLPNWLHAKGVVGLLNPAQFPAAIKSGGYAVRALINPLERPAAGLPSYADLLDHNMTLTSSHAQATLGDAIKKKVGVDLQANPSPWKQMSDALGWYNPVKWLDFLIGRNGLSFKGAMLSEDLARLQIVYQGIQNGLSTDAAVKQLDAIFPTNRISEGQRAVATKLIGRQTTNALANPSVTQFAGYHASLFQVITNDVKQLMGKLPEGGTKKEAADRIAGLILGLTVLYPAYDAILKAVTGNPNAVAKRGGVFAVLYNIEQLLKSKENKQTATQSIFTPSPVTEALIETALNRDFFTGKQPIPQSTPVNPITAAQAFGSELGGNVSLAQNASQVSSGAKPLNTYLASLVGVSIPKSSPSVSNLDSLIYDQRPTLDAQVKAAVAAGNQTKANQIMASFNKELLDNLVDALIENKQPSGGLWGDILRQIKIQNGVVGDTSALRKAIVADPKFKADFLAQPSATVMKNYKANQGQTSFQKLTGQ